MFYFLLNNCIITLPFPIHGYPLFFDFNPIHFFFSKWKESKLKNLCICFYQFTFIKLEAILLKSAILIWSFLLNFILYLSAIIRANPGHFEEIQKKVFNLARCKSAESKLYLIWWFSSEFIWTRLFNHLNPPRFGVAIIRIWKSWIESN